MKKTLSLEQRAKMSESQLRRKPARFECRTCGAVDESRGYNRRYCTPCLERGVHSRLNHIAARYNITRDEAAQRLLAQNRQCAICKIHDDDEHLVVDHDHITGAFRAWLCRRCNTGIGMLREDPAILQAAIAYIHTHKEGQTQ